MVRLKDGIKDEDVEKLIEDSIKLRKRYVRKVREARKKSQSENWEIDRNIEFEVAEKVLSRESFENILPTHTIEAMKKRHVTDLFNSEFALHDLAKNVLEKKLRREYEILFWYTGRCKSCNEDTESIFHVEEPVLDSLLETRPDYFNAFSDKFRCGKCGNVTESVKTGNIYSVNEKNDYNLKLILARIKIGGRHITKLVELCSGKKKDLRIIVDKNGMILLAESKEDCMKAPDLLKKYHSRNRINYCRDYFVTREVIDPRTGKKRYESDAYTLYWDGNGTKKRWGVHPIEAKKRGDEFYSALHFPIEYKGIPIGVQAKTMDNWVKENDRNSSIFHGTYDDKRPDCTKLYYEERSDVIIKAGWGEFERRFYNYLKSTKAFEPFNDIYTKDMLQW